MNQKEPLPDLDTVSLLVPKAKNGSEEAKEKLFAHVQDYMNLMAQKNMPRNLQGKFGASDVVQQSLAKVIVNFEDFRGNSKGEFLAWLRMIVTNESKKFQRDYHRDKRDIKLEKNLVTEDGQNVLDFTLADRNLTPGSSAIAVEQIGELHNALEKLSDDHAEVIRLRSLEQLSFKEVAERMDRNTNSVTKLWYRAILKLQEELNRDEP